MLDGYLKDKEWLVGDKCTYADLSFVTWSACIPFALQGGPVEYKPEEYPHFERWHAALLARPSVQKVLSIWSDKEIKSEGSHAA